MLGSKLEVRWTPGVQHVRHAPLLALLVGLCMALSPNATAAGMQAAIPTLAQAQTEFQAQTPNQPQPQGYSASPGRVPGVEVFAVPDPGLPSLGERKALARIALLLPLQSETLAQAAQSVRAGFLAAAELQGNNALTVEVIESGESPEDILAAYGRAVQDNDIVVGPLSRSGAGAIAYSGAVSKPTVALAQAEPQEGEKAARPANLLFAGLSLEEEARQVAGLAHESGGKGKAVAVLSSAAWQRRAAKAFADQWRHLGQEAELIEMDIAPAGTYLAANSLVQLKKRIQAEKPSFLFAALDALQARQMRLFLGNDTPVYGTSQLNSYELAENADVPTLPEMNGVRLVDIPWLLQPDHPAVMAYPKPVYPADQKRNAVLERLYALGIDAYRIAAELAMNQARIELDGVTGRLAARLGKEGGRFERLETPAVYRDGKAVPLPLSGAR